MRELISEVYGSIRRNRLRTCLTGLAVAWGIFMLIVLLGTGNALRGSFESDKDDISTNVMSIYGGLTTKPYGGYRQGRQIKLDEGDVSLTLGKDFSDHVDKLIRNISRSVTLANGAFTASASIDGTSPEMIEVEKLEMLHGRFINEPDMNKTRKTIVLPENTAQALLPPGKNVSTLIGKRIKADGVMFLVVGITKSNNMAYGSKAYAPFTTVQRIWATGRNLDSYSFTFHGLETMQENSSFTDSYRSALNARHSVAPDDMGAFWISNRLMQNMQMDQASKLLNIGLFIIGLFTLLGGIVGVSNIMLITVRERTHEFGIRKAIGATPGKITRLVIAESVTITSIFGYIGMVLGMLVCELIGKILDNTSTSLWGETVSVNIHPSVSVSIALEATLVLVVAGTLAGLMPAIRAARIKPIEALRAE